MSSVKNPEDVVSSAAYVLIYVRRADPAFQDVPARLREAVVDAVKLTGSSAAAASSSSQVDKS